MIDKLKRAGCNEPFPITPPHGSRRWRFIRTDGNLGRMPNSTSQKPPADRRDLEYFAMAVCYGNAATLLNEQPVTDKPVHWPFFQLVAHALELSLKAVLSHQGRDEEWLMMIGHSLERCYTQASAAACIPIAIQQPTRSWVRSTNPMRSRSSDTLRTLVGLPQIRIGQSRQWRPTSKS
ncbi:hypothetical protein [Sphingomonas sp. SRS2]|uniref:hypothetical protein n=1 Tax=Sphingomonas sp. SRS2 TaxID=133190 RepID=UPI00128D6EC0|nr:hypothetical protein [Sphingomonas sp. SRS2]